MKDLISHIEYLLHSHNCVIVPGLGGFVLNSLPSEKTGIAEFSSPKHELVFNRDLTHNDGLLSESYMKVFGFSFEKATQSVEVAAQELRKELLQKGRVDMGKLGAFVMHDEKRFVYEPNAFLHPDTFGLSNVTLKPIIQLQPAIPVTKTTNKKAIGRNIGIGTAAAAVIALLLLIFPFNNQTSEIQNAQIFSENGILSGLFDKTSDAKTTAPDVETKEIVAATQPTVANPVQEISSKVIQPTAEEVLPADTKKYYIVVGVYEVPKVASQAIESLKAEGFVNVDSLPRSGRTDVFIETFTDRTEAENRLREIHKNYHNHRDAWVLKR